MIANGPIDRWIKFIEINPTLDSNNLDEAKGVTYRGVLTYPWSKKSGKIADGIRTRQCYFWTNDGESLTDKVESTQAMTHVKVALIRFVISNPDDTNVTGNRINEVLQTIIELKDGYL